MLQWCNWRFVKTFQKSPLAPQKVTGFICYGRESRTTYLQETEPSFQNKARVQILAELEKERERLMQNQTVSTPGASIPIARHSMKDFRDSAEQQHIVAQQKAALQHAHAHSSGFFITQDSSFGNLILPVLPRLEPES
ncbi:SOSS complex subunit C isoform X1 [Hippocampus comes]|uniref:SOSS complex subunit C isoform X1 n=1 Tax=Hippocampus comes TaxID=109280 RepID=UPI00094E2615|nr:PREDICTED: SOSS complex subunit C isoform X1 [Hippocampus comes]